MREGGFRQHANEVQLFVTWVGYMSFSPLQD